jgi:hypothetical protein
VLPANNGELKGCNVYKIMGATTRSIDVSAAIKAVYNQWTQFEEFLRFMEGVIEIRRHGPKTLLWKVNIGGKHRFQQDGT